MPDSLSTFSTRSTPQSQPATPDQVVNAGGGYTFTVDDKVRLNRFLTLGTDGGTFYAGPATLALENAQFVARYARENGPELVKAILEVSTAGRAPRQNPALFALAIAAAHGDEATRRAALGVLPLVCRTGSHLTTFVGYVEQHRGWGRALRTGVGRWFLDQPVGDLAYQSAKYKQREGWALADVLRLAHPVPADLQAAQKAVKRAESQDNPATLAEARDRLAAVEAEHAPRRAVFDRILGRPLSDATPALLHAVDAAHQAGSSGMVGSVVRHNPGLSWEMLPSESLNDTSVWDALLENGLPITALIRQLPRLTRLGVLAPMGGGRTRMVAEALADPERLKRGRVHPINVLVALRTYASGGGARSDATWTPVREIVDALDRAFYASYGAVTPAGKRTMLAIDVSGSMGSPVSGLPITCREASVALAMVTAATEPTYMLTAFTGQPVVTGRQYGGAVYGRGTLNGRTAGLTDLPIGPRQRLDDVIRHVDQLPFGPTDCALPMLAATQRGIDVDTFLVLTDNETWYGDVHPHQALQQYRQRSGINARLAVVGMTATGRTIADPSDPGQVDFSGFDANTPNLLSAFSRGDL
jgi:60 kDa SS-A/Ro ribonucleoprotein